MTDPKFIPEVWSAPLLAELKKSVMYYGTYSNEEPDNLRNLAVWTDETPEWLKARKRFIKRWKKLNKMGLALGYLKRAGCYDCSGELEATTNTTDVKHIPNPNFDQARHDAWQASQPDTVIIQSIGRP